MRVLDGAVPPSGITGAAFYGKRLLLAGQSGGPFRVWSVDLRDGPGRLEIEKTVIGESEGLEVVDALGGVLHWLITPFQTGRPAAHLRPHQRAGPLRAGARHEEEQVAALVLQAAPPATGYAGRVRQIAEAD